MGVRSLVKQILTNKENKRYEKLLSDRRMTYGQWIGRSEEGPAGKEPSGKESSGKKPCEKESSGKKPSEKEETLSEEAKKAEFWCFLASRGSLAQGALRKIERYFSEHPEVMILYGDEDVLESGQLKNPWFKPDWSPDLLDSCFYFGSVVAVRREAAARTEEIYQGAYPRQGMDSFSGAGQGEDQRLCRVNDFAAYEKWIHICVGRAGGYQKGKCPVGHISGILFHCEKEGEQRKYLQSSEFLEACREEPLRDFLDGWRITGNTAEGEAVKPVVSIVIPSRDQPDILKNCLQSCRKVLLPEEDSGPAEKRDLPDYVPCEILVVDNGSSEENRISIQKMTGEMNTAELPVRYWYQPMEFNFSRMCNLGAEQTTGNFLLFLNDDIELCVPGCIGRMAALADRFYTGAVGMKLYYPGSVRIQHAGITSLPMGPVHKLQFLEDDRSYYFDSNRGLRNVSAVTAACLMVERDKFMEAGGFTEELRVAFNDVDLCFTLRELGYYNVCRNDMYAYHHESLSRGSDETPEKLKRLLAEREKLFRRHPEMEGNDPYYSFYLNREGLDTRIRPGYETAGNHVQRVRLPLQTEKLDGYRQDPCVLIRVESIMQGVLQGYGVVLGDNNACYDKEILLIPEEDDRTEGLPWKEAYAVPIVGQYRPDLVENMPDQTNVGLSGFWMDLSEMTVSHKKLPQGSYRIGLAVRNRVTGLRLMNNSNRYFTVPEMTEAAEEAAQEE